MKRESGDIPKWSDLFGADPHYTCRPLPRLSDEAEIEGTVRTVESLHPPGHYRITLDVKWCPDPDTCPVLTPTANESECDGCLCPTEHDGDYGSAGHAGPCPPHTCDLSKPTGHATGGEGR